MDHRIGHPGPSDQLGAWSSCGLPGKADCRHVGRPFTAGADSRGHVGGLRRAGQRGAAAEVGHDALHPEVANEVGPARGVGAALEPVRGVLPGNEGLANRFAASRPFNGRPIAVIAASPCYVFKCLYRVPEILTLGRFPDARESDSTWRTQEVRHVGSDTIAPRFWCVPAAWFGEEDERRFN